jgi:ABC-2 type transport system permease protein
MNSTLAEAAGDTPRSAPPPAARARGATVATLVRREFWEHRYLWLVPVVTAVLIALCGVLGRTHIDLDANAGFEGWMRDEQRVALSSIVQWVLAVPLWLVLLFLLSYYTLDCLYAERKDRSILFWKSLPLSDELTVGSKLLVATVVVPLGTLVLASAADLVFAAILAMRVPGALGWSTYEWLRTELVLFLECVIGVLWYSPIAGALLLFSAWIPRNPILWATLAGVVPPIVERVALGTHYIWTFEIYRTNGIWHKLAHGPDVFANMRNLPPVGVVLDSFDLRAAFTDVDLWLGVLAALALTYAAARIRRYRDDT